MHTKNKLKEFKPKEELAEFINSYWFFKNDTEEMINWPVVPDGCSDIIFYLDESKKLEGIDDTFVAGIMDQAELVPIPKGMGFFGIRFNPGMIFYILKTNMKELANEMRELKKINKEAYEKLEINRDSKDSRIIETVENQLKELLLKVNFNNNFSNIVKNIKDNPQGEIQEMAEKYGFSIKSLERAFYKKIGIAPKKFARIMRFQKAHKEISRKGLGNLVVVALSSGYFDQAHFNQEYKKLVGYNPSNDTVSILYNK